MTNQLRTFLILPEDPSSIPSICNSSFRDLMPLSGLLEHCINGTETYIQAKYSYTCKEAKRKKLIKKEEFITGGLKKGLSH